MPKYDDPYAEAPSRLRSLSAVEATRPDVEPTVLSSSFTDSLTTSEEKPSAVIASEGKPCAITTSEVKPCARLNGKESPPTHISESSSSMVPELNGEGSNDDSGSATDVVEGSPVDVDTSGTYDEPWDLRAARLGLETRLRAAQSSSHAASSMQHVRYESRYKTMDPRPAMEYDEPWDRRAKDVQRSLIYAKSAKEEARVLREGHGTSSHVPVFSSNTCRVPNASRHFDHSSSKHGASTLFYVLHRRFDVIDVILLVCLRVCLMID